MSPWEEELCVAVYQVREVAGAHVRPSSLSRIAVVAGSEFYVASCVQKGSWHGVRKVDNDYLSNNLGVACTIGWVHENNLVLFAGYASRTPDASMIASFFSTDLEVNVLPISFLRNPNPMGCIPLLADKKSPPLQLGETPQKHSLILLPPQLTF